MSLILVSATTTSPWQHRVPALPSEKHTFRIFSDADRLLLTARESSPAAIVIAADVLTPAHLGLIRLLSQTGHGTPILIASGSLSPDTVIRCARAGATHVFTEPCSNLELLERLERAIYEESLLASAAQQPTNGMLQAHQVKTLRRVIHEHLTTALDACNGNRSQAAKLLGIDRSTLRRRLSEMETRTSTEP